MENYKTIKEIADELGVSKDKVKYQVRKLPSNLPVKIKGVTYLNNAAISIITERLSGNLPSKLGKNTQLLPTRLPTDDLVENLKSEIESKDYQIKRLLDNQEKIQNLLDQQQQLTLQSNKQIEKLQLQLELKTDDQEEPENNELEELKKSLAEEKEVQAEFKKMLEVNAQENDKLQEQLANIALESETKKSFWRRMFGN